MTNIAGVCCSLLVLLLASCSAQYYNYIPPSAFNWSPWNPGFSYDQGYGTNGQDWFKGWNRVLDNYGFSSSVPYGYGSGAAPMYGSDYYGPAWTSYGYGGYTKSSLPYVY